MKILIGCEESQVVCKAFRKRGHEAYSNDITSCSGGKRKWHLKMDIFDALQLMEWDMLICFPPCTYLSVVANRSFINNPNRWHKRLEAMLFVHKLVNQRIGKICLENPVGVISSHIGKPTQIIQPYEHGHKVSKRTCLWLRGLPLLKPTKIVKPRPKLKMGNSTMDLWYHSDPHLSGKERSKRRSKTFKGIAKAMANQWS